MGLCGRLCRRAVCSKGPLLMPQRCCLRRPRRMGHQWRHWVWAQALCGGAIIPRLFAGMGKQRLFRFSLSICEVGRVVLWARLSSDTLSRV